MPDSKREQVGSIYVDAGIIWVGDPCYTIAGDSDHHVKTWDEYCTRSFNPDAQINQGVSEPFGAGIGLEIATAWGDGEYPVYVTRTTGGRIASVTVVFDGEDE